MNNDLSKRSRLTVAIAIVSAGLLAMGAAWVSMSASAAPNPPGNNGTIKIEEEPLTDQPNNEPHVDCLFLVEFRGYDEGDLSATVTFELQAPTLGGTLTVTGNTNPLIGGDPAGGANDLDASEEYRLDFGGPPHPIQGYHVKVTVHAEGSIGADTKYKVFWVQPCEAPTPTPTPTPTPPPTTPTPTETPTETPSETPSTTPSGY
jgi:hypothetical protein